MRNLVGCCLLAICVLFWAGWTEGRPGAQSCFLRMQPSSGVISVLPRSDVSFECDASCLGQLSRGQLKWKTPRENVVPELGSFRVHSVGYNRWMVNRLVVRSAMREDSGVYTCEVKHQGRHLRYQVTLHVEEDSSNQRRDDGPRRGDIYVEPEPVFGEVRPVRDASHHRYRSRQGKKMEPDSPASQNLKQPGAPESRQDLQRREESGHRKVDVPAPTVIGRERKSHHEDLKRSRVRRQAVPGTSVLPYGRFQTPAGLDPPLFTGPADHWNNDPDMGGVTTEEASFFSQDDHNVNNNNYIYNPTTVPVSPVSGGAESRAAHTAEGPSFTGATTPNQTLSPVDSEHSTGSRLSTFVGPQESGQGEATTTSSAASPSSPGGGDVSSGMGSTSSIPRPRLTPTARPRPRPSTENPDFAGGGHIGGGSSGTASESHGDEEEGETDFGRYGLLAFCLALAVIFLLMLVLLLFFILPRFCQQRGAWNLFRAKSKEETHIVPAQSNNQDSNVILLGERPHKPLAPMASATGLNGEFITPVDLDAKEGREGEKQMEEEEDLGAKKAEEEEPKGQESFVSTFLIGRLSSSKAPEEEPATGAMVAGNTAALEDNVFAPASSTPIIEEKTSKEEEQKTKKRSDGGSSSSDEDESNPSSSDTSKDPAVPGGDEPKSLNNGEGAGGSGGAGGAGLMAEVHLQINPAGGVTVENVATDV